MNRCDASDSSDSDYDLDLDSYQPIRLLECDHEVMIITPKLSKLNHDRLQTMHNGSTFVHWEGDNSRSCMCFLKLEVDNATLTWRKPMWSALRGNNSSVPDYAFKGNSEIFSPHVLCARYSSTEDIYDNLDEGFINISIIKDVFLEDEESIDLSVIAKRYGLEDLQSNENCICILYGSSLAENKRLYFIGTKNVTRLWYLGLQKLVCAVKKLHRQTEKCVQWLKLQYLQLYYECEKCQGPTPAEAIKVQSYLITANTQYPILSLRISLQLSKRTIS